MPDVIGLRLTISRKVWENLTDDEILALLISVTSRVHAHIQTPPFANVAAVSGVMPERAKRPVMQLEITCLGPRPDQVWVDDRSIDIADDLTVEAREYGLAVSRVSIEFLSGVHHATQAG